MKNNRKISALSVLAISALGLAACGGGGGGDKGNGGGEANPDAIITTNGTEPQNPLIPTNTTEVGGGKIIDLIFAGLVSFEADGTPRMDQAESIEPNDDNTVWTVKLKEGLKFSDGTPVTSDSFIKAWNYGADVANAQGGQYFFDNIKGYSAEKKGAKLTGLKKVSDTEFTVELINPEADFLKRIGYSAFVPLPESAFKDMKKFGENPVGNGPYKFESEGAWKHNQGVKLVKSDSYKGPREPKNGGVEITFYESQKTAYADTQADRLDILDQIDPSNFATYEADFDGRNVNQPAAIFQSFTIPQYLDHFKNDEEGKLRRQAISMAIDREEITKTLFDGTRTPASDFTSPVLEGWDNWGKNAEGNDVLKFNPEEAKKRWAEADKISKYEGTFTIAYNADGGHQEWVDALSNQLSRNLGIKAQGKSYPAFKGLLDDQDNDKMTGAARSGWQADYPSQINFLAPLYKTGAGSNYGRYTSKEFDGYLEQAGSADSPEKADELYAKAQATLLNDLPAIPLWYNNVNGVWSSKVDNVEFGWNSVPIYTEVTKSE